MNDACLRVGDSYFMKKQYMRAVDFYAQAENTAVFDVDYSIFQQAICYGLSRKIAKKKAALSQLINEYTTSPYIDDAKFALADIHFSNGLQEEGLLLMKDVVDNHPFSPLVKTALLKLGLYHYNTDNTSQAAANFKRVIEDYPATSEAAEALVGLKNVYVESGDVKSYFAYVEGLSNVVLVLLLKILFLLKLQKCCMLKEIIQELFLHLASIYRIFRKRYLSYQRISTRQKRYLHLLEE